MGSETDQRDSDLIIHRILVGLSEYGCMRHIPNMSKGVERVLDFCIFYLMPTVYRSLLAETPYHHLNESTDGGWRLITTKFNMEMVLDDDDGDYKCLLINKI